MVILQVRNVARKQRSKAHITTKHTCKEHDLFSVTTFHQGPHGLEPVTSLSVLFAGQVEQTLVLCGLCTSHSHVRSVLVSSVIKWLSSPDCHGQ